MIVLAMASKILTSIFAYIHRIFGMKRHTKIFASCYRTKNFGYSQVLEIQLTDFHCRSGVFVDTVFLTYGHFRKGLSSLPHALFFV